MTGPEPLAEAERPRGPGRGWLLAAFAVSGAAALSYEVIWTRSLSVVLGSTTYAVSSMLATFMLGLAIGGMIGGRFADRVARPALALGLIELGIGLLGVLSMTLIRELPGGYLWLYRTFHLAPLAFFVAQIALCGAVMLLPTILMGMTFPFFARIVVTRMEGVAAAIGTAYAANTVGAVMGSLAAGFALVPALGLTGAAVATAGANVAIGIGLAVYAGRPSAAIAGAVGVLLAAAFSLSGESGDWTLVSFYTASRYLDGADLAAIDRESAERYERVFAREGADGRVNAFRSREGELVLQVGGKLEGTTLLDRINTALLAYLPAAAHAAPRRMLVVGLGAGVTVAAAKRVVPQVEVVEISGGVIDAVRRHGSPGLLDGVQVDRDDARTRLLLHEDEWDAITSEPSYPSNFAVGNLFTREYYALAASRLAEGGVYAQWLPGYLLSDDDLAMMLKTFTTAFPFATLWLVPDSDDYILLGSRTPFSRDPPAVFKRVTELNGGVPLPFVLWKSGAAIREIAARAGTPVNSDDHPRLEFRVATNIRVGRTPAPVGR